MITRFAPSPTGLLHLGHAYSALSVQAAAAQLGGIALLRIEDTDSTRVRPEFEDAIYEDLHWLGLSWPEPVRRQSDHYDDYRAVLKRLAELGILYPCSCNRRAIQSAGAKIGSDGYVYPGTCCDRPMSDKKEGDALRLNLKKAFDLIGSKVFFVDNGQETNVDRDNVLHTLGDPVLQRKETEDPAYHLACTHDDAAQGVTHVVRGADIAGQTPLHVILQRIMDWPTPEYIHHNLVLDDDGKRLAKISRSKSIAAFRAEGYSPSEVKQMAGWLEP